MAVRAEPNAFQKLCLIAECKRWRVRLTIRQPEDADFPVLEDLCVDERDQSGWRIVAVEPLDEQQVTDAAEEILRSLAA